MKRQLETLKKETRVCKICFEKFNVATYTKIGVYNQIICKNCLKKFKSKFIRYEIEGIRGLAIFNYDDTMKQLIYQFKGCGDYELYPVFLDTYKNELSLLFHSYVMIPIPSSINDDEKREFNHVKEMFGVLKLPMIDALMKTDNFKQSDHTAAGRRQIIEHMKVRNNVEIYNKNILIVDDISTTGNTLKAAIKLLKERHPKRIRILTLCKRELDENYQNNKLS